MYDKIQISKFEEQINILNNFMLSEDLEELQLSVNKFNIFKTLNIINRELKHSDFLAWLLNPYENHALGNYFLKEFLKSAIKNYACDKNINLELINIFDMNLSNVQITREREENIDILIKSKEDDFICVIENKIWANEGISNLNNGDSDSQLTKYADYIYNKYPNYKNKMFIFLAPKIKNNNELIKRRCNSNNNDLKAVYYIPVEYEQIYDILCKILKFKSNILNNETKIFIEHYKENIERYIMGNSDEKIIELCRKIYFKNKEAIDLINQNVNNIEKDFFTNLCLILQNEKGKYKTRDISQKSEFCYQFLPDELYNRIPRENNRPILYLQAFWNNKTPLKLQLAVVQESKDYKDIRDNIESEIKSVFKVKKLHGYKSEVFYYNSEEISKDYYSDSPTDNEIQEYIEEKLNEMQFLENVRRIASVIK